MEFNFKKLPININFNLIINNIVKLVTRGTKIDNSWRSAMFGGWLWSITFGLLVLSLPALFLIGVVLPILLFCILATTLIFYYKMKVDITEKIIYSQIFAFFALGVNVYIFLIIPFKVYFIFSLISTICLIVVYFKIIIAVKNYYSHLKGLNTNFGLDLINKELTIQDKKDKDIINIENFTSGDIPPKPIKIYFEKVISKITNTEFKNLNKNLKGLTNDELYYINSLQLPYKRAILNVAFFELEIVKLYLKLCNKTNNILIKSGSNLKKRVKELNTEPGYYNNTLYTLFCISEFCISNFYLPEKKDVDTENSFNILNEQHKFNISEEIKYFVLQQINELPELPVKLAYSLNRNKWKHDLIQIFNSELNLNILKSKCDVLVEHNSENPNQYLIYFELCKKFAKISKTSSLWYYYKYYRLSLNVNRLNNANLLKPQTLPASIATIIFGNDDIKLKQFENICSAPYDLSGGDESKKELIRSLFTTERKKLNLDVAKTQKALEVDSEITIKLNKVLLDDDMTDQSSLNHDNESTTGLNDNLSVEMNVKDKAVNVQEFFSIDSESNEQNTPFEINELETELLTLFKNNNFNLTALQVDDFAKSKKQFTNSMIKKINQKFYESFDDSLIEQDGEMYLIANLNQTLINEKLC